MAASGVMSETFPVVFVTGGTGFLGSHFVREALAAGWRVRALRRPGSAPRISLCQEPEWIEGDLGSVPGDALRGCDGFVHLSAVGVSPQKATWEELFRVNVFASLELWRQAADHGVRWFLFCGSLHEYGTAAERYERIPTTAPLEPVTAYAASKAAASLAAEDFVARRLVRGIIFRLSTIYGEGQSAQNFWPALRAAALGGLDFPMTAGEQIADFLPVKEAARQILALRAMLPPPGKIAVHHVGSGDVRTLHSFAEEWWARFGACGHLLPGMLPYREPQLMRVVPAL